MYFIAGHQKISVLYRPVLQELCVGSGRALEELLNVVSVEEELRWGRWGTPVIQSQRQQV